MVCLTGFLWLLVAASLGSAAQSTRPVPNTIPGAYIIEFEDGQDVKKLRLQAEPNFDTRVDLNYKLFKGVSIQLHNVDRAEEEVVQLSSLPAVKNIWPVKLIRRPDPEVEWTGSFNKTKDHVSRRQDSNTTEPYSPHVMSQIDRLHAKSITGKGIKIAVVDSGIDYKHPQLGGCFGDGCLVTKGYDFVGDDYNGWAPPVPDDDPMDCDGHGTHVAGIISAAENEFGFRGAAPGATLFAYRVFGCSESSVTNDILIAAFNQAYEDGADIITASIGGSSGWSADPLAVATSRIVDKGVPCTIAAGNSGDIGLFDAHTAATGKGIAAVASFDNTIIPQNCYGSVYTIDDGQNIEFPYDYSTPDNWDGVARPLWATSYNLSNTADACEPLPEDTPDLGEYIVLVRRGSCGFLQQAQNVAEMGARFLIIYNTERGFHSFHVGGVKGIVAAATVQRAMGERWVETLAAGSQVMTKFVYWEEAKRSLFKLPNIFSPGAVSAFSSWGPTFEMNPKPQFGAVGASILSTYLTRFGGYAIMSGTSMATPLVAAAFSLVAEARGTADPQMIENLLAVTSNPQLWIDESGNNGFENWLTPPAQQGAGLIQVYDAAYVTTLLKPSSLSFNDTDNNKARSFSIGNEGNEVITYNISHVSSNSIYVLMGDSKTPALFPDDTSIVQAHAKLSFSETAVTIAPGEKAIIEVTATPPRGVDVSRYPLWSGYITVNGTDGSSLSVPYQGLAASLHDAKMLSDDSIWVATSKNPFLDPLPPNVTFHFPPPGQGINYPRSNSTVLVVNLNWGSPKIVVDAIKLTTDPSNSTLQVRGANSVGRLSDFPSLWEPRGLSSWYWSGALDNGEYVPPGSYKLLIKILRIFGDESNEEDWVVAETTSFHIRYIS